MNSEANKRVRSKALLFFSTTFLCFISFEVLGGCGATATASFSVSPATPKLIFGTIASHTLGDQPFTITASSPSTGNITYAVLSGPAGLTGNVVNLNGAGLVTLQAAQAADTNYGAATATASFSVSPATPKLIFGTIASHTLGDQPFTITASSPSTGSITYAVLSGPAGLTGNVVNLNGAGLVTLQAAQAADTNYGAATATASFSVSPATPKLIFGTIASHTLGDQPFTITASSPSTGSITYAVLSGPAGLTGNVVNLNGAGLVTLQAAQAADTNYGAATATASFSVLSANEISILPSSATLEVGESVLFRALSQGIPISSGLWSVQGGPENGTIDRDGTFHAPPKISSQNPVTIEYEIGGTKSLASVFLSPLTPIIVAVSPETLTSITSTIVINGSGFVPESLVTINDKSAITTFIDGTHLSAIVSLPSASTTPVSIEVVNEGKIITRSLPVYVQTNVSSLQVSPSILSSGPVLLTVTGTSFPTEGLVFLDNKAMTTITSSSTSITAKGYLPPWKVGAVSVGVGASSGATQEAAVAIQPSAVPFDEASRFATQAAFGPRSDVVARIQQIGLSSWITEQLAQPAVAYDPTISAKTQFNRAATGGTSLLRLRLAWSFQNFLVSQAAFQEFSAIPYEVLLEKDSTGNFRQLMTDLASDANIGTLLNLAGNNSPTDQTQHPNQNFAREMLQLFTIGVNLLNEDGSLKLDASGDVIPAYTQDEIVGMSRVFTGWQYPPAIDPHFTGFAGFDYSQPLIGVDEMHDQGSKIILGGVSIPANQGIVRDRQIALDTIFDHPNLPPFISRLLIQHLVKSSPTPAYVQRIAKVFEDDGSGVRGNLTAVVTAILLDSEARSGDTIPKADDGFLQEPVLFQFFAGSILQLPVSDDQTNYYGAQLGQNWWYSPSVFGSYHPDYLIPGTSINSPEFQIFNNQSAITRSAYLWAMITGTAPGYNPNYTSWLYTNFTNVPDLLDALDHLAFHGQMPAADKSAIIAYCQQLDVTDLRAQFQSAIFLALNSDSYTVTH